MGLIRLAGDVVGAAGSAAMGTLNSSIWKEYFVSGDMSNGVLMKRAEKVLTDKGRNKRADDNLISSGSGIDVQEGQCMIIVDNGAIVEFCAEPGRYTYDRSTSPSLLCGENKGLKAVWREFKSQLSAGGQRFSTQRVYFINLGRIWEPILWGLGNVGFTHSFQPNPNINPIRMNVMLKAHGSICTRIDNPINFYKEFGAQMAGGDNNGKITVGTFGDSVFRSLKSAISSATSSAISQVSRENPMAYTEIMAFSDAIADKITEKLSDNSLVRGGFGFYDFYIEGTPELSEKDYQKIMDMEEKYNMVADPMLANYDIQKTMASGFHEAGKNGGVTGIMGMGMAMGGGMGNLGNLQGMPNNGQPVQPQYQQPAPQQPQFRQPPHGAPGVAGAAVTGATWTCECGHQNTGKFCMECGSKKPEPKPAANGPWTCSCGAQNTGKFCMECGSKRPEAKRTIRCDKCGWVAPDGITMKFCPECGDPITGADYQ